MFNKQRSKSYDSSNNRFNNSDPCGGNYMSEFERGIKAGKAKAITAMVILVVTFLGGRYGRDLSPPDIGHNQLAASEFIDMPTKKTIY